MVFVVVADDDNDAVVHNVEVSRVSGDIDTASLLESEMWRFNSINIFHVCCFQSAKLQLIGWSATISPFM